MATDASNLTETCAALLTAVETDLAGRDVVVGDVLLIVELRIEDDKRSIRVRSNDGAPPHVRLGLLAEAMNMATVNQLKRQFSSARSPEDDSDTPS